MRVFHLLLISATCLALAVPAHAWGRSRFRFRGRRIARFVRKVFSCKIIYGVGCPVAVNYLTSGAGAVVGKTACKIQAKTCKRTLADVEEELEDVDTVNVPFDGDFDDYDDDKDGLIDFAEFYDTVTSNVPLKNPAKLGEVFHAADVNDDDMVDMEEFKDAPFDFGDN